MQDKNRMVVEVASFAHDEWRKLRLISGTHGQPDARYEPRIKPTGLPDGGEIDIANTSYANLPPKWQKENKMGAESAVGAILDQGVPLYDVNIEAAANVVHDEWMKRNMWAKDDSPHLFVPYEDLAEDEKEKDRVFVRNAIRIMSEMMQ